MTKERALEGLYADPDLYYEDGIYYLYPTTDGTPGWAGDTFYVFTSKDGKHFEKAAKVLNVASDDVAWATGSAWAPCFAARNGKYYFYFCAKNETGESNIGVAVADHPTGPFVAEKEPMITMDLMKKHGIFMWQTIDPSIFKDGDDYYIAWGNGGAAVAKLSEDMCHMEEDTIHGIEGLTDFRESVIITKRQGVYHFTWSCDDTGSENYHVNYGVSDSLLKPVTYLYPILTKKPEEDILGTGHHCILELEGDEYLIGYHRFATPTKEYPEGKGYHREVCIDSLKFDENNRMMPVE